MKDRTMVAITLTGSLVFVGTLAVQANSKVDRLERDIALFLGDMLPTTAPVSDSLTRLRYKTVADTSFGEDEVRLAGVFLDFPA